MLKQISKIKLAVLKLLEQELITVLAISFILVGVFFVKADSAITNLSFIILDDGTLTVTAPNGAEDWQINSLPDITWTSTGMVASVKIELQRTVGGSWETIVTSTLNDGIYSSWSVTAPATTTATIRISSVTVPAITDSSDAVFIISAVPEVAGSSGGYVPTYPDIWSVIPITFPYTADIELIIRGTGFETQAKVTLNQVVFPSQQPHNSNWMLVKLAPSTLAIGTYRLCVANADNRYDCFSQLITVTDIIKVAPPTTGGASEEYSATLVRQFSLKPADGASLQIEQKLTRQSPDITLKPRATATLWAEFENIGTATWYQNSDSPVRLGTDTKRDRKTGFYHSSWIKFNRPALVNKIVKPGEIGRFEFTIQAPWTAKTYTEYFRPVAEWKTWMGGKAQVKWVIAVEKQSFWKTLLQKPAIPTIVKPNVPSTGGAAITPFQPQDTLLFTDNIEKIYQKALQLFTKLLINQ